MSSTSGLSRRRPANGAGDSGDGAAGSANSSSSGGDPYGGTNHSRTNSEDRKIAFDPNEIGQDDEDKYAPKLTLMEEVLLLGLKDKQGYLSFWNDNISYTLRGCILMELALRDRIAMVKDPNRRRFPLADRYIEVISERLTGEVLLDEALKMMRSSEKMSVANWIDLMSGELRGTHKLLLVSGQRTSDHTQLSTDINSPPPPPFLGETWNVMKIGYQLKQVRERLAKGLVDKGILRTEKRNFLLFDMATHPVSDGTVKDEIIRRVCTTLVSRASPSAVDAQSQVPYAYLRTVAMICAAYAANVLENALMVLGHEAREKAYTKVDELLGDYSVWPLTGTGAKVDVPQGKDVSLEVVAAVLNVYTKMDSI
ncbi:vacuolar protein sorting-associated protein 74, partial [Jimgerdemannia flammicorona]